MASAPHEEPIRTPWDARLTVACQDVPVPAELQARIEARLAASREAVIQDAVPAVEPAAAESLVRRSRRWWLAGAGATVAATVAGVAVWQWPKSSLPEGEALYEAAIAALQADDPSIGQFFADVAPPKRWSPPRGVYIPRETTWRSVADLAGASGVAFDLSRATGRRATVYVIPARSQQLPRHPNGQPFYSTAGCVVGAWQNDGLLYVLVVEGDQRDYRRWITTQSGDIT